MMRRVRTTVTLDADTRLLVERAMRERDITFKEALNDAIRAGLAGPAPGDRPGATVPRDMGAPLFDLTRSLELYGQLEDEEIVRKLASGR